jgi:5-methylcytosine-specific restriction endonuclease McrA
LAASTVCSICGHDGSDSVDHVIPLSVSNDGSIENQAPAHHLPCPTCGRRCNREKGVRMPAEVRTPLRTSRDW